MASTLRGASSFLAAAPLALALAAPWQVLEAAERPNIILVNIDDMGYGDISAHGNPEIETPHLDRLHGQSVRFTDFHVAPMCTPTRGMLITGIDALRNGARWVGTENTHLRTDLTTKPEMFREAGYRTGLFGKWHLGDNYPYRPQDRGFDEVVWHPQQEVATVNDYWGNDYFDDVYEHNGVRRRFEGYCTDVWFREAMNWMEGVAAEGDPFLCWIPTNAPHGPYFVDQAYRDRVGRPEWNRAVQTFYGMVYNIDDNMGRLMDWLDDTGLADNTILVFMTDNGGTAGTGVYNAGMRGAKTHLWEGGHRVPLFIRWPDGRIGDPRDIDDLTTVQDLLPTFLELADVPVDEEVRKEFDGISLAGALRGAEEIPDRTLVVQFMRRRWITKHDAVVMRGPWRLVNAWSRDGGDPPERRELVHQLMADDQVMFELFNLDDDPGQRNDILAFHPDIVRELLEEYEAFWARNEPYLEMTRPTHIGNDAENPMFLAAPSWADVYFTQRSNVLDGRPARGWWNVHVDEPGLYQFELRRWPKESGDPIQGTSTVHHTDPFVHGPSITGTALPIKHAQFMIGDFEAEAPVGPQDTEIVFTVELEPGPARLQGIFLDADKRPVCGVYFMDIERLAAGGGQ